LSGQLTSAPPSAIADQPEMDGNERKNADWGQQIDSHHHRFPCISVYFRLQLFHPSAIRSHFMIAEVRSRLIALALPALVLGALTARAVETAADKGETPAQRGYRLLLEKPYLTPDFDQQVFDELWKTWEEPLRKKAEAATPDERRKMAYSRYGLVERPNDRRHRPLQYVVDEKGNWTMNCLSCHQGKVAGKAYPGVPNSLYALETLTEEVHETKQRLGKPSSRMETGAMLIPLGTTNGTTNAVMFGVVLLAFRDADLNWKGGFPPPLTNHDHDAPAWWNFHRRRSLYSDGFAAKSPRAIMQFLLDKDNSGKKFREWEEDFKDIYAWLDSLEPPKYPFAVDAPLAERGHALFDEHCARCHGTAGRDSRFPNKIVPIETVGTDPVRLSALTVGQRTLYSKSWFGQYGKEPFVADPGGYVAPPLDGIWASAPYFHNGSVPTLWHVLHADERPKIWRRTEDGYDQEKVGLEFEKFDLLPQAAFLAHKERHRYFDTSLPGKSAAGHRFQDNLNEDEKRAVLEYLKTI
jgi:mono/diheme cytochrome c family protein